MATAPSKLPTGTRSKGDTLYRGVTTFSALVVFAISLGIVVALTSNSWPTITALGGGFLTSNEWNPVTGAYGALSSIFGTVVSTLIAIIIAVPLSLVIALFLVELMPPFVSRPVSAAIELLAAVPSIIYGMWGLFVFAPFMADHVQPVLKDRLGFLPLFQGPPMGIGMLTAGLILALMVLPFITAVMRDVFEMVPKVVKEASFGMGSTPFEVMRSVTLRHGFSGIVGAVFLGLGRAIGETMAVTFVIGNAHGISASLFSPGNSIASTLANEFTEASDSMYMSALIELGLVLFAMTVIVQLLAQIWIKQAHKRVGGVQ